jgi:hypothetical protein
VDATDRTGDEFVLRRTVYGTTLTDGQPSPQVDSRAIAHGVRAWLGGSDPLIDGKRLLPLFTYRISEPIAGFDLNGDGDAEDEIVFGDSNEDGTLDDAEIEALLPSSAGNGTDLADNLGVDARLAAHGEGDAAVASLVDRIRKRYPKLTDRDARQFVRNSIVRVDVNLLCEFEDTARGVRVRRRVPGWADLRNALLRLGGMTR